MKTSRSAFLVVGASGTIGSAVAEQIAGANVSLGLHYCTRAAAAEALKSRLEQAGAACDCLQSSLADEADCRNLVERFHARAGTLSGIALCAGTVRWKRWDELDRAAWEQTLFEHCIAPFTLARAAVKVMGAGGRIVFLSSIAPKYGGSPISMHYAAAKAGLESAMRGLSRQVARAGICVNGVRAGFVDTPQQRSGRTADEIAQRVGLIPAGRAGTPEEVASALAYLLSDRAAFVNGELITVAGGD